MLDKIILKSPYELVLVYTHRPPFTLYASEGNVLELYSWFLRELPQVSLLEFRQRTEAALEDTCEISLAA